MIIERAEVLASLAALPEVEFAEGDLVLRQDTRTERLLFLEAGAVDIVRDGMTIVRVTERGAVFGDMAVILGQPHSADVRAAEPTRCHVLNDAAALLEAEPALALYVMTVLASRLDAVNRHLIEARQALDDDASQPGFLAGILEDFGRAMRGGGVPF